MRRLDQWLANLGYCSRREAREWVETGRVQIGGRVADDPGRKADASQVRVDGEELDHPSGLLLMLHKPLGRVCSHDPREGPSVYDLLPERWRRRNPAITSVGRLDKDTSGLLLLTDESALVHRLTSPRHKVPKHYRATVDKPLFPELITLFAAGTLQLTGEPKPCEPAVLSIIDANTAEVILTEGKYHQVRRMFASQGLEVTQLHRYRLGPLELGNLSAGQWRELAMDALDGSC